MPAPSAGGPWEALRYCPLKVPEGRRVAGRGYYCATGQLLDSSKGPWNTHAVVLCEGESN